VKVNALGFLLFAQLQTVADHLGLLVFPVLSGSEVALFNGTFVAEALRAFQEELDAFPATETTHCIGITCQVVLLLDDRFTGLASPFVPDEISVLTVRGHSCPRTAIMSDENAD
jgi:hypothetical protein